MQEGPLYPDDDFDGDDLLGDDDFDGDDLMSPQAATPALELVPPQTEEEALPGNDEADNTIESVLLDDVPQYDVPRATSGGIVGSGLRKLKSLKVGRKPFLLAAVAVGIAGIVVAAVLLTSTLPGPSTFSPVAGLQQNCADSEIHPDPPTVQIGSSGRIVWWCGLPPSSTTVLKIDIPSGEVRAWWIDWTHGPSYQTLFIYRLSATEAGPAQSSLCFSATHYRNVGGDSDPQGFTSADNGDWNYCSDYNNAPSGGLGSITVEWRDSAT